MKKGFTIVELLVVVAIIGILAGIVGVAATGSMKTSRRNRAEAMKGAWQQAVAAYYSQEGRWPGDLDGIAKNGPPNEKNPYVLTPSEVDSVFQEIVRDSVGANATRPLIEVSALFVARASSLKNDKQGCFDKHGDKNETNYCGDKNCINGMDFQLARSKGVEPTDMAFGWQGEEYGKFCRFWIKYNWKTDSVTVTKEK